MCSCLGRWDNIKFLPPYCINSNDWYYTLLICISILTLFSVFLCSFIFSFFLHCSYHSCFIGWFFCFVADSQTFFVYFKRNKNTAPDGSDTRANLQLVALRPGVSRRTLRLDQQDEVGMWWTYNCVLSTDNNKNTVLNTEAANPSPIWCLLLPWLALVLFHIRCYQVVCTGKILCQRTFQKLHLTIISLCLP